MVKIEYEVIDIDEQPTHVGLTVKYVIDGVSKTTQFSFNPKRFYMDDSWKDIIKDFFKRMKEGLESEGKKKFKKSSVIGKKNVVE